MFTTHFKRIIIACSVGILLLLLWKTTYIQSNVRPEATATLKRENQVQNRGNLRSGSLRASSRPRVIRRGDLQRFQASEFYRTLVDNNIFRPLGWTPKVPPPAYRLIGTIIARDGKTAAQAILQTTAGNQTHIVGIGDTFAADTTVTDITNKQVTLDKSGKQITLKLDVSRWIHGTRRR